jgi:hypothetical protein
MLTLSAGSALPNEFSGERKRVRCNEGLGSTQRRKSLGRSNSEKG